MNCEICETNEWKSLDYLRDSEYWENRDYLYEQPVGFKVCKTCGFLTYDYVSDEELGRRYNMERPVMRAANIITCNRKNEYHKKFLQGEDGYKIGMNVLDVGCAQGSFLNSINTAERRHGVELNKAFASFARNEYGLEISEEIGKDLNGNWYTQDTEGEETSSINYDLITYYHVLEHIQYPLRELEKAKKFLSEDGVMYISVPLWMNVIDESGGGQCVDFENWFHLNHVNVFSKQSFKNLLFKAGLEIVKEDELMYGHTVLVKKLVPNSGECLSIVKEDHKLVELWLQQTKLSMDLCRSGQLEEAIKVYPKYPEAYISCCLTKDYMRDFDKQRSILEEGLKNCPGNSKLKMSLAKLYFQWDQNSPDKQYFSNNIKRSQKYLLELAEEKPGSEDIYLFLGLIEAKYSKNYDKAVEYMKKVIEINPTKFMECWDYISLFWKEKDER